MMNKLLFGLLFCVFAVNIYANGSVHKPTEVLSVYDFESDRERSNLRNRVER